MLKRTNKGRLSAKGKDKKKKKTHKPLINRKHKGIIQINVPYFKWKLRIFWKFCLLSLLGWFIVINHYEHMSVKRTLQKCDWKKWETWSKDNNGHPVSSHRVALFADPQILDDYSYPNRPWIMNYVTKILVDHYHIRNWKYVQYHLNPQTNFFLGDLFDGGRNWEDEYWLKEYKRFNQIFPKKPNTKTVMSLPGNHDIGFGDTVVESSLKRFSTYFGPTSSSVDVGNHTFVLVDTISLSDRTNPNVSSIPQEFLDNFTKESHPYPRIMLTHVPLHRDPEIQSCGPERESKKLFPMQKGLQYQTVIDSDISQMVLSKVQPDFVFSGDDHDYCHIKHTYNTPINTKAQTEEITVKSCAMNMGISKPAIQLVSLYNDGSNTGKPTIQTQICYLPDPFEPIWGYIIAAAINFVALIWYLVKFDKVKGPRLHSAYADKDELPLPVSADDKTEKSKARKKKLKLLMNDVNVNLNVIVNLLGFIFMYYYK
ncbi:similar to Saccharomyces cerevisiae YDR182W CDC1 Putative lipid phosphatase of the endoplasmic reticulum [Maudiozyma barnettii]|uniref:Similar to Saccharomyces cerevisiae YDR182W CDC1 Putative lipid phosphatase of the endoplasmic reticulum n=1 Tax=Maudiozyma barnettii TaxID=61262 RepID=A0A8H2VE80_9SACH|nr:putative lipid phosphatase CDC1 [Kazachstania barnettii]CAB4253935.1 similar to Saccharomyces cerevisiae YDR182W CDC1 Putative lipid phosphatase of the endoplasmic reticulum [Kazachstania barnettii]CAD1781685.1 similar to Saccharomyces cerevisiae YDR182W CDC1 Putative lipid phosphatase of the endoplasmic reticulum [Kazachstania barnettii]